MRALGEAASRASAFDAKVRARSMLVPVATAAILALNASAVAARPADTRGDGASSTQGKQRSQARDDADVSDRGQARPREHARRDSRRRHAAGRARPHAGAAGKRHVEPGAAILAARADIVPMQQRSLVASHPLVPDPAPAEPHPGLAPGSASVAEPAPPRCRGAHRSVFALALASFGSDFQPSEPAMVEGAWPQCRGARNVQSSWPQSNWQLASLGPAIPAPAPDPASAPGLSGGGSIHWVASAACLTPRLRAVLAQVAANFGPLTVNSTCRSPSHNRRVGGAPRSYHLTGNAVDFRVRGSFGAVHAFLARQRTVGGLKHYGAGVFHIDTGPRRTWGSRRRYTARQ
jgi:Peptidase M15